MWDLFGSRLLVIRVLQLQDADFVWINKWYVILSHKQTIKICLTPCHVVKQHLFQLVVATLNTDFGHFFFVFENFRIYLYQCKSLEHEISFNSDDSFTVLHFLQTAVYVALQYGK